MAWASASLVIRPRSSCWAARFNPLTNTASAPTLTSSNSSISTAPRWRWTGGKWFFWRGGMIPS
ncbi:MAG: hypothetical protein C3F18_10595 [Nitrosomonadales bacterium]|nr:MAG: hypothetical protein C3F18_10595 [Nitrosomonadales bacterium]